MRERFCLIDYMHLAHKCANNPPLSANVVIGGQVESVDTTIVNYTLKNIVNYSQRGSLRTGVFFEGGSTARKDYFMTDTEHLQGGYKGNRVRHGDAFFRGADMTLELLKQSGVSCYKLGGFEADDLIYHCVLQLKQQFPNALIDVITNDSDLLPLVDENVSVYIRATREYYEEGSPRRANYFQVTPRSWETYFSFASAFKGFYIPYNAVLLYKIIRGDTSDNVPMAVKGYGGVKFTNLVYALMEDGVNFADVFRYGRDFDVEMGHYLRPYFTVDELERIKFTYYGLNLRAVLTEDKQNMREMAQPLVPNLLSMQTAVHPLRIRLM